MGTPTSVRMHFSNRCRASGVRSVHPPIRPPQRQSAENIRFRGPPLIRLRRRNRRPQMLTLPILQSPLAMMSTRLSKTKTWLETGLCYTDGPPKLFEIYTLYNPAILLYLLVSRGEAFRKWSDMFSKKKFRAPHSMYDGCTVNDAILFGCNCQPILDTLLKGPTSHQITRQWMTIVVLVLLHIGRIGRYPSWLIQSFIIIQSFGAHPADSRSGAIQYASRVVMGN